MENLPEHPAAVAVAEVIGAAAVRINRVVVLMGRKVLLLLLLVLLLYNNLHLKEPKP